MPDLPAPTPSGRWTIRSIVVRVRDGPQRLDHAYRLLLAAPPAATAHGGLTTANSSSGAQFLTGVGRHVQEAHDACSDLCPRLDRPPGTGADD